LIFINRSCIWYLNSPLFLADSKPDLSFDLLQIFQREYLLVPPSSIIKWQDVRRIRKNYMYVEAFEARIPLATITVIMTIIFFFNLILERVCLQYINVYYTHQKMVTYKNRRYWPINDQQFKHFFVKYSFLKMVYWKIQVKVHY